MAEYAVECVDKADGRTYVVRVHAETHQQAIDKASKEHVAGRAHRVDFSPPPPPPAPDQHAVLRQLHAMQLQQSYQHRSVHGFNPLRALALLVVVLVIIVVVGLAIS